MNRKSSIKVTISLILIIVFTGALLGLVGLSIRRNSATNSLQQAVSDLGRQNRAISLGDRCIEKLFALENSFRLYAVTGEQRYRVEYLRYLDELGTMLNSLEKSLAVEYKSKASLQALLEKKAKETDIFLKLKNTNDSLIEATASLNITPQLLKTTAESKVKNANTAVPVDQTNANPQKTERKLFGRILEVFGKKKTPVDPAPARSEPVAAEKPTMTLKAVNALFKSSIDQLTYNSRQLSQNERQLILSTEQLLDRLSAILNDLKQLEVELQNTRGQELNMDAQGSLRELSDVTRLIIILSVVLALMILFSAWQLFKHDKKLNAAKYEAIRQTQVRGDILAHMSHEIRTPLNSILGFSEQLEKSDLTRDQKEQVGSIRHSSKILLTIVNEVLDLSKFDNGNLNLHTTNFYPEKTIKHVVASLEVLAAKKNLKLNCICELGTDVRLAGDEYRLKQVMINLVNNAIKFTESGEITICASVEDYRLFIDVTDTGRGIAREDLKTIFNEFTQITTANDTERHNGSGLGLAICKKIVEAQGGVVSVRSELGKGSVFSIQIPYLPFQPELEADLKIPVKPVLDITPLKSMKILVADDDQMNIKLITTILKKWGLHYDVVTSGRQAFELFVANSYDMVLTDIHMPDGDGLVLTKLIREHPDDNKSAIPVIAITANAVQKDLESYMAMGMNDHVIKPFSEQSLYEKIRANATL